MSEARPPSPGRQEAYRLLLKALLTAVKSRTFYPLRHPTVTTALRELSAAVEAGLELSGEIAIGLVGREIVADGEPLAQDSPVFERFRQDLAAHEVERLSILAGVRIEELEALVDVLASPPERVREGGGVAKALADRGVHAVQVRRFSVDDEEAGERGDAWRAAERTWESGLEGVRSIAEQTRAGKVVPGGAVREIADLLLQGLRGQRGPMLAALALRRKSSYTFSHSLNVSLLMLAQVEMLGLSERQLEDIATAGLLHDVGKLLISDEIIEKPGKLTPEEWEVIRRHPVMGAELLVRMRDVGDLPLVMAFEHHVRHDGAGYPLRRHPWPMSLAAEVGAIADCYDAMRSTRPYNTPLTCEQVYERMGGLSGTAYHPELLDRFFRIVGMYAPGTVVRLSTGAVGKVVRNHPAWHDRPVVQILRTPEGEAPERAWLLDLGVEREQRGEEATSIVSSVTDASF